MIVDISHGGLPFAKFSGNDISRQPSILRLQVIPECNVLSFLGYWSFLRTYSWGDCAVSHGVGVPLIIHSISN